MRKTLKKPLSLGELLPSAFTALAANPKELLYSIQEKWDEIVGLPLGKKTLPLKIYKNRLVIAVAGSAWANELELSKGELIEKLKKNFPHADIDEIRFQMTTRGTVSS